MISITEVKSYSGNKYKIEFYEDKTKISSEIIALESSMLIKNKKTYFILYDKYMNPISDVFRFINFFLASRSPNTRERYFYDLKIIYTFLTIFELKLDNMNKNDIARLQHFLKGYSPQGYEWRLNLITKRSNRTVNGCFAACRTFLKFLGKENSILFEVSDNITCVYNPISETSREVHKYENDLRAYNKNIEVPQYISVEEFKKIIHIIRDHYTLREEVIVRLMYEVGLRIGEVLGLTGDDIVAEESGEEYIGKIYIRNRCSDKPYQQAKSCMNVVSEEQYSAKEYNQKDAGYQVCIVNLELIDLINKYIEDSHIKQRELHGNNYLNYTRADRIRVKKYYEEYNYYIFINKLGKPILLKSWNNIIHKIFIEAGIPVDREKREKNLNHRFRHGFAMFQIKYMNREIIELSKLMRHRSIESTMIYYSSSQSDIIEMKNKIVESLYSMIPELKID